MPLTHRQTRSVLRTVIPLLALVWASLPLHHCSLAFADQAGSFPGATPAFDAPATGGAAPAPHCHQSADPAQPAKGSMSCSDLGRAGPDLRPPAVVVDTVLVHVSFDARWLDRGLRPVSLRGGARPLDDARWRLRPLHLQKSVLLI